MVVIHPLPLGISGFKIRGDVLVNKLYTEKEQALDLNAPIELSDEINAQMQKNVRDLEKEMSNLTDQADRV